MKDILSALFVAFGIFGFFAIVFVCATIGFARWTTKKNEGRLKDISDYEGQ